MVLQGLLVCFFSCLCALAADTPEFRPFLGTSIAFALHAHLFVELKIQKPPRDSDLEKVPSFENAY